MLRKEYAGFVITCSEQLNLVCLTFPGSLPYSNDHPHPGFLCKKESPASGSSQERKEQWNVDYLLENLGCPARGELISFKGFSLILCEALRAYLYGQPRGQTFTVSSPPRQEDCLALKSFQWVWKSRHQETKEMVQKKTLHVQGSPEKLGESGTERQKEWKPGQMRRKCKNRAAGHAAFSSERKHSKWEERWYLLSSYLGLLFCVCMPTLEEKATGKLPSPDIKCCLYSCVAEPRTLHPGGGGRI